jgi:hypothetical protein
MRFSPFCLTSFAHGASSGRRVDFRRARWLGGFIAGCLIVARVVAQPAAAPATKEEFSSLVKLAPFVVSGKSLAISIYARTRSDRRYGEQFSEGVVKVIHEAVTESTGKGLVIIGAKGEPHPSLVLRKFLALANDGQLDVTVAARGPELAAMMERWRHAFDDEKSDAAKEDDDLPMDFEQIFTALPLRLEGVGAKLYQLAWEETFDDARVEAKLRGLRPGDLERRDLFKSFDWVFYLPPKGVFDRVLDDLIATALKQEQLGFFARTAVKGVLLVIKPKIRRAIEGMRQGMMFTTVVEAQTSFGEKEVSALADAYVAVLMPFVEKKELPPGRTEHERAVNAVRAQLQKNAVKPKPLPEPEPTATANLTPAK